jgi:endogenous inhibitor of DNA gyrase (YacG/DUF329 family)
VRIVCPICKKVIENAPEDFPPRPFCSPRCKLVDLENWLNEAYRISSPAGSYDAGESETREGGPPHTGRKD